MSNWQRSRAIHFFGNIVNLSANTMITARMTEYDCSVEEAVTIVRRSCPSFQWDDIMIEEDSI